MISKNGLANLGRYALIGLTLAVLKDLVNLRKTFKSASIKQELTTVIAIDLQLKEK